MKLKNTLIVVKDIDKSVEFYKKVLNLKKIADFGENKTLSGGLCLQTERSWLEFIGNKDITYKNNAMELYFEVDDFDKFNQNLKRFSVEYVHTEKEHAWGQRVVRFYDLDSHVIEVGESLANVFKRFLESGMSVEQVAKRVGVTSEYVKKNIKTPSNNK